MKEAMPFFATTAETARHKERGAVALEYLLIAAIVAIGLIGVFRMWGRVTVEEGIRKVAVVPTDGGALEELD